MEPDFEEYVRRSEHERVIAIEQELTLDVETPVSIYLKLVGEGKGYILESVDTTQEAFGRYSFIGNEPLARLQIYPDKLLILEGDRLSSIVGKPVDTLKKYMHRWKIKGSSEPLMSGGLVGYLNYEIGATFDRVRGLELGEEELLGELMISRLMVVHDALKQRIKIICLSTVDRDDPRRSFEGSLNEIKEAILKLRSPMTPTLRPPTSTKKNNYIDIVKFMDLVSTMSKFTGDEEHDRTALEKLKARLDEMPIEAKREQIEPPERPSMPPAFEQMISTIQKNILDGEVFQVVPSVQFREKLSRPGFEYYRRLRQVNGSPYMYYINFGENKLCGASPEMLVKVQGHRVWTFPIAGTRPRGATPEDDARLADELLHDEKELAEHAMLVDLARNDLGRLSEPGTVRVTKLRSVERFSHVMHLVSSVEGTLRPSYEALDVLKATFPAGTVSGAPKLRAMELISELEPVRRGSYAGVVGYMDFAGNLDMCIDLRTMRIERDRIGVIQAGAGIVADSVAVNEWNEILNKAAAMRQVVREVERNGAAD